MEIIGFAGPAGCGKDTAGAVLITQHGYTRVSFAAPLKRALEAMGFPTPETADEKEAVIPWLGKSWRVLAQTLGTEWGRESIHPDLWVTLALRELKPNGKYVFTDVRFENEARLIREFGGRVIHIKGRAHSMSDDTAIHASETGLGIMSGDFVLNNCDTLEAFGAAVSELVE